MNSSFRIFDIAGSALSAQSLRLNTVASNLANADVAGPDPNAVFKAHMPVFKSAPEIAGQQMPGVRVLGVVETQGTPEKRYEPGNPMSDAQGFVYSSGINPVEQMVDMISASRSYQNNVEVMNTAKEMALKTLTLGS
ncbi:MAG: flagellar basal body rod protein FlgC [Nevskia sp.]|nr:flagellar basal body rod protein FlgC [Nevskia sp.]